MFRRAKIFVTLLMIGFFCFAVYSSYATPPSSKYTAGETLNPTCSPGDTNCSVVPLSIGDEIGSSTSGSILFADSSGNLAQDNSKLFWDDTNNRFGIGTTTPSFEISVVDATSDGVINIDAYAGKKPVFGGRSVNGTTASPSNTLQNDIIAEFAGAGYGDTGFSASSTGSIRMIAAEDFDDSSFGTNISFRTTNIGSTSLTAKAIITSEGLFGIGTESPSAVLDFGGLFSPSTTFQTIRTNNTIQPTTSISNIFAINNNMNIAGSASGITLTNLIANRSTINTSGSWTGTVGSMYNFYANNGTNSSSGSPTINTYYGFYTEDLTIGTSNFGFVGEVSSGGNKWNLYMSGTADNYLAGDTGIGDSTPDYLLDVENASVDTDLFSLRDSDGACLHNPESGAETVSCSSDERLKTNIEDADSVLSSLRKYRIREYDVIASGDHLVGIIAQEALKTHPEIVNLGPDGYYTVDLPNSWTLVKAIQELDQEITDINSFDIETKGSFYNTLVSWLGDRANGIAEIFSKKLVTEELCLEDVCIDKNDLKNLLEKNSGSNTVIYVGGGSSSGGNEEESDVEGGEGEVLGEEIDNIEEEAIEDGAVEDEVIEEEPIEEVIEELPVVEEEIPVEFEEPTSPEGE